MKAKRTRRVVLVGSLVLVVLGLGAADRTVASNAGCETARAAHPASPRLRRTRARPLNETAVKTVQPARVASPPKIMTGPRGRYRSLVRKLHLPGDRKTYGDFYDWGYWSGTAYRGHKDLPKGYWVYVYPHWLIYAEDATRPAARPTVSAEPAVSPAVSGASKSSYHRNYGTVGRLYVDGGGIYFTLMSGETAMNPKTGYYHLSMGAGNYQALQALLYRAAEKRWVVKARTNKKLNPDGYGQVQYLVADF